MNEKRQNQKELRKLQKERSAWLRFADGDRRLHRHCHQLTLCFLHTKRHAAFHFSIFNFLFVFFFFLFYIALSLSNQLSCKQVPIMSLVDKHGKQMRNSWILMPIMYIVFKRAILNIYVQLNQ